MPAVPEDGPGAGPGRCRPRPRAPPPVAAAALPRPGSGAPSAGRLGRVQDGGRPLVLLPRGIGAAAVEAPPQKTSPGERFIAYCCRSNCSNCSNDSPHGDISITRSVEY